MTGVKAQAEAQVGDRVVVLGHSGISRPYRGLLGEVVIITPTTLRWVVKLDDGEMAIGESGDFLPVRQVVELAGEVQRLREALLHASPMLRAGIKYHQQSAHAAHALPGTRDRARHQQLAANALWEMRLASHQGGAERALAALTTQEAQP